MNAILRTIVILNLLAFSVAYAHKGATGIVKERMDGMKEMSDSSKHLAKMFKSEIAIDTAKITQAAELFIYHGRQMADLFPDTQPSREGHKTEALPKIWQQPEAFNQAITEFIEVSESLKLAAENASDEQQLKRAFRDIAQNCKECHKQYRQPKRK